MVILMVVNNMDNWIYQSQIPGDIAFFFNIFQKTVEPPPPFPHLVLNLYVGNLFFEGLLTIAYLSFAYISNMPWYVDNSTIKQPFYVNIRHISVEINSNIP